MRLRNGGKGEGMPLPYDTTISQSHLKPPYNTQCH